MGDPLRALSTLSYSDNVDLQRSAALAFAEITEKVRLAVVPPPRLTAHRLCSRIAGCPSSLTADSRAHPVLTPISRRGSAACRLCSSGQSGSQYGEQAAHRFARGIRAFDSSNALSKCRGAV